MGTEQRKRLAEIVTFIREWKNENLNSLLAIFMELDEMEQSEDVELWEQLRQAFKINSFFRTNKKRISEFIGYGWEENTWWYKPENW